MGCYRNMILIVDMGITRASGSVAHMQSVGSVLAGPCAYCGAGTGRSD
jgi:hypothetical protein